MNIDKERLKKMAGFAGFLLALSAFFLPVFNPDIFWHFSAARYMAEHLAVPRADFLAWPTQGREWVDFEWLAQLIFYGLYKLGGFSLLVLFKGALLAGVTVVSWRTAALGGRARAAWLYLPFFAAGLVANSDLRPENFSLLFFALLFYRLERERLAGVPDFNWRSGALAALFFAAWTNLHAGYLYGLVLLGIYFLGGFIRAARPLASGRSAGLPAGRHTAYLKYAALGLAASLANPYGWKIYGVILNHLQYAGRLREYVQEWNTFDITNLYQAPYAVTLAGAFGLFLWRFLKTRELGYENFGALLFFSAASAGHCRHIPFFMMIALPYCAALPGPGAGGGPRKFLPGALKAAALVGMLFFYKSLVWADYTGGATLFASYSEGLSDFLKANKGRLSGLRLFNSWEWGGFLGYKLYPDYKVFADGRYLFHEKLQEAEAVANNRESWKSFAEKYKFDLIITQPDTDKALIRQKLPDGSTTFSLRPSYLSSLPQKSWAVIYWDARAVVLVRRRTADPAWLQAAEYRYFRPADLNGAAMRVSKGKIRLSDLETEIRRYLKSNTVYYEGSGAAAKALRYQAALKKLCGEKNAKCRP